MVTNKDIENVRTASELEQCFKIMVDLKCPKCGTRDWGKEYGNWTCETCKESMFVTSVSLKAKEIKVE